MPKLKKRFAALVAPVIGCVIGIALTACGGGLTVGVTGIQSPNITSQPANQSVAAGQSATFSVAATGSATLGYQWKKNGSNIDGATSSSYTTPATSSADNGARYSVSVSNSTGTVTSGDATLTVNERYSLVAKASGGFYDKTECVKDLSTGLFWEGKTASGTRAGSLGYTNYDGTSSGQGLGRNPTQTEIDASTNSIGYAKNVNASALCGYTDWRLPTKEELQGILLSGTRPTIDATWFPNTQANYYRSSSPDVDQSYLAWVVSFYDGNVVNGGRDGGYLVRLVR